MVELQIIMTVFAVTIQTKFSIGKAFTIKFQALRSGTVTWLPSPTLYSPGLDLFLVPTKIRSCSRSKDRLWRLSNTNTGCIPVMRHLEVSYKYIEIDIDPNLFNYDLCPCSRFITVHRIIDCCWSRPGYRDENRLSVFSLELWHIRIRINYLNTISKLL